MVALGLWKDQTGEFRVLVVPSVERNLVAERTFSTQLLSSQKPAEVHSCSRLYSVSSLHVIRLQTSDVPQHASKLHCAHRFKYSVVPVDIASILTVHFSIGSTYANIPLHIPERSPMRCFTMRKLPTAACASESIWQSTPVNFRK